MRVTITFDANDDLCNEHRDRIGGSVLTCAESSTARWTWAPSSNAILTYRSTKRHADVLDAWESEGYELDEFVSIRFTR